MATDNNIYTIVLKSSGSDNIGHTHNNGVLVYSGYSHWEQHWLSHMLVTNFFCVCRNHRCRSNKVQLAVVLGLDDVRWCYWWSVCISSKWQRPLSFQVVRESSSQPHCPLLPRSCSVHHWGLGGWSWTWNFRFFSLLYASL